MFITQLSVYLENDKGTLRSLTKILAENNIDILALSVADTTHFGIIRIVVREGDIDVAIKTLRENGFMAKTNNVVCVAVPNKPSGLDGVLAVIEKNNISIEYMYSLIDRGTDNAYMVFRLADEENILEVLEQHGLKTVSGNELGLN